MLYAGVWSPKAKTDSTTMICGIHVSTLHRAAASINYIQDLITSLETAQESTQASCEHNF